MPLFIDRLGIYRGSRIRHSAELLAALASCRVKLTSRWIGGRDRYFVGCLEGTDGKPLQDGAGLPISIIFSKAESADDDRTFRYALAAWRLSELLELENGAPPVVLRKDVEFVDPYSRQSFSFDGWLLAPGGDDLNRALRLKSQQTTGGTSAEAIKVTLKNEPELVSNALEAIFFRMILLGERDASGQNFVLTPGEKVINVNINPGSAFTSERSIRLIMHPFFGRIMCRLLEEISGRILPAQILRKAADLVQKHDTAATRADLAQRLGLELVQVESMLARLIELFDKYGGCMPQALFPEELKSTSHASPQLPRVTARVWQRIRSVFGV